MKTGGTCHGEPNGHGEAVQNRMGTVQGQVRDVNTNSNSGTGQRVDLGGAASCGSALQGGGCWWGLAMGPFCSCAFPVEMASVRGRDGDGIENTRWSAARERTLLPGTPAGVWRGG